mmetsp:Transcript_11943/g.11832  ORF Transcript_11943/g.11832 Transcript_11943/m.11832 type:complete len:102 (-) Transcript_11943:148-453(-)
MVIGLILHGLIFILLVFLLDRFFQKVKQVVFFLVAILPFSAKLEVSQALTLKFIVNLLELLNLNLIFIGFLVPEMPYLQEHLLRLLCFQRKDAVFTQLEVN